MENNQEIQETEQENENISYEKEQINYIELDKQLQLVNRKIKNRIRGAPATVVDETDAEKSGIEHQLDNSDKALSQLLRDGNELITNIRIANDKREIDRRNKEAELREELLAKLQQESIEATAKFEDITARWKELDNLRDPMGIYEGLEDQKGRVEELMQQKDIVIDECRKELEAADLRYILDQEKQNADIYCLVERIDRQIIAMKHAYRGHLELLQNSIDNERDILRTTAAEKWNILHENREENEEMKLQKEKEQADYYAKEMERITLEHDELTRVTKIRLERDNEDLQIELENLKGNVLLNADKLDYNFQVLKRREEENIIIKNQQKHRISKLNETINSLKKKIRDLQQKSKIETTKLTEEITKWRRKILELEDKADLMLELNDKKYQRMWKMNQEEGIELLNKVLGIDKLLFEQQLGLQWEKPDMKLIDKEALPSYIKATKLLNITSSVKLGSKTSEKIIPQDVTINLNDNKIFKTIIRNVADHAGFLLEHKLLDLIQPYTENDQTLVRIDNVFYALGISNIVDVSQLKKYFIAYAHCPNCMKKYSQCNESFNKTSSTAQAKLVVKFHRDTITENKDDVDFAEYMDDSKSTDGENSDLKEKDKINKCENHYYVIEPIAILSALREYIEEHIRPTTAVSATLMTSRLARKRSSVSRLMAIDDVKLYWERFQQSFSTQKESLWNALEHGIQQYIKVLKRREKLGKECEDLKRQNNELKFLMQKYMHSRDNKF